MTDVHHCPFCELRFVSRAELEGHIAIEHPGPDDDDTVPPPGGTTRP
ncbi:MAG TPA: hypothetical protein VF743_09270 [Acidimicrobiales bacterium]